MPSPDLRPYVDLTIFDLDAQRVFDLAMARLQTRLPEWVPNEANVEVMLMEALAVQVEEAIFAINRLPGAIFEAMLKQFNVDRDLGAPATTTIRFTVSDDLGHDVPAGTRVSLPRAGGLDPLVFSSNVAVAIPVGSTTGVVAATALEFTADANGIAAGAVLSMLDAVPYVETVVTTTSIIGGRDPETDLDYFARATSRFARLSETLVLPKHFVMASLENPLVQRAQSLDNYTPAVLPTPTGVAATASGSGGSLAAGTYSYRVSAVNQHGETIASTAVTATTPTGTTGSVRVDWTPSFASNGATPPSGHRIYGRVGGSEGLIASVGATANTFTDTGAAAVGADKPKTTNTTGGPVGFYPGHTTVAVYGDEVSVPAATREAIRLSLEDRALAALTVHVTDPTINSVDVTATVHVSPGHVAAQVRADCEHVLRTYLSPMTWPWEQVVRRNRLIALLNTVLGVNYVAATSPTVPAGDVTLKGTAPLVQAGILTITVVEP